MQKSELTATKRQFSFIGDFHLDDNELYDKVFDWCHTNTTDYYAIDETKVYDQYFEMTITLHSDKDAMLFKLQFNEFT